MSTPRVKFVKILTGCYTFTAVGRTFTVTKIDDAHRSLTPWVITDEDERTVYATGASRALAVEEFLAGI